MRRITTKRGRIVGAIIMVLGVLTFTAGTAGAAIEGPYPATVQGVTPTLNLEDADDADNVDCEDLGYEIQAKYDASASAGDAPGQASGEGLIVNWEFNAGGTIDFEVDETSEYWVAAALVKQASENAQDPGGTFIYDYVAEPPTGIGMTVSNDQGLVDPRGDEEFSHITFCGGEIPPPPPPPSSADLTIVKAVTGDVPEEGWSVDFTSTELGDFTLSGAATDASDSQDFDDLAPGTYTAAEVDGDFDLTDITCTGLDAGDVVADDEAGTLSVTLEDGDDAECTFTNDYADVEGITTTQEPEEELEPAAVLGSQVTRTPAAQPTQVEQLAFTGSGTEYLALAGVAMVLLGGLLVLGDRKRRSIVS